MPIYEYRCAVAGCGADFESIRPVARADDPIECPACGQPATRQISNFSFKSDTFTAPKLRRRPGATFRGNRPAGGDSDANASASTGAGDAAGESARDAGAAAQTGAAAR